MAEHKIERRKNAALETLVGGVTAEEYDEAHRQWIWALGYLTYLFGQLEWCSYAVLNWYSLDGPPRAAKDLLFKARTALARDVIRARLKAATHAELAARWDVFFDEIQQAGDRRNGIVHNPLTMSI